VPAEYRRGLGYRVLMLIDMSTWRKENQTVMAPLTECGQRIVALTNSEAERLGHEYVGLEHILLGIVASRSGQGSSGAASMLESLGLDLEAVRKETEAEIRMKPPRGRMMLPHVFDRAIAVASMVGEPRVSSSHILFSLLTFPDAIPSRVLARLGVGTEHVRGRLIEHWTDTPDS